MYAVTAVLVFVIVVVILLYAVYYFKYRATALACQYALKGYITAEEMEEVNRSGEIVLGEEIEDREGNIVVLQLNEEGEYVAYVIRDSEGNSGHTHVWEAHKTTRLVEVGSKFVVDGINNGEEYGHYEPIYEERPYTDYYYCSECGVHK